MRIHVSVNGETAQDRPIGDMIFSVVSVIRWSRKEMHGRAPTCGAFGIA